MKQMMKRQQAIEILKEHRNDCENDVMLISAMDRAMFDMRALWKLEIKNSRRNRKDKVKNQ